MPRATTKKAPMTENLPTTTTAAGLPAELAEQMLADAGRGVSTAREDNIVPLIYILHPLSPQVNKRNSDYIDGAEGGSIWLRNAPTPIVSGEEGILFQPCHFSKDWVEWVPRDNGGGFVGRSDNVPADAERREDPKQPAKVRFIRPNGNEVIGTRYHIGFVYLPSGLVLPYVIPMSSTGHTVSRQWMVMMNARTIGGRIAPSWAGIYRLKTKERSNAAGTWFTWDVQDAGWVQSAEDYARGRTLNASFEAGEQKVEAPDAVATVAEDEIPF